MDNWSKIGILNWILYVQLMHPLPQQNISSHKICVETEARKNDIFKYGAEGESVAKGNNSWILCIVYVSMRSLYSNLHSTSWCFLSVSRNRVRSLCRRTTTNFLRLFSSATLALGRLVFYVASQMTNLTNLISLR